jgi:short-subunit dehydrogenase
MSQEKFTLAFVTGASSGIGSGICRLLANKGISLFMTGRNREQLNLLADELRSLTSVETFIADISLKTDRNKLIRKIQEHKPDLIINNAGYGLYGLVMDNDSKAQSDMIEVNAIALLEFTLEGIKTLIAEKKGGIILNVSSIADKIIIPGLAVYGATKAFVTQVSRSIDEETKPYGIRVLVSCPGVVSTDFRRRASGTEKILPDPSAMDVYFAAEQIWKQIVKEKQIHYFNWKAHLTAFFARYIIPQKLTSKFLLKKMESFRKTK